MVRKKWKKAMFGEVDFSVLLDTFWGAEPEQETVAWFQQMAAIKRHFPYKLLKAVLHLFTWSFIIYGGKCVEVEILVQH